MCKRIVSFILCVVFVMASAVSVRAREEAAAQLTISSADEFLAFAQSCRLDSYSLGLQVTLEADIDLEDTAFESIPVFSGTFYGNGHTVSGLSITADGSVQGLFRYLTASATVQDLHVQGDVRPGGSRSAVGGLAGSNEGRLLNCSFAGTVSGGDSVGGLVGINTVSGMIENCRTEGSINGNHFVGGIAGENAGVIRSCSNLAQINTTAQQNSVELSDITMDSLTESESANTVTDIGGIAGTSSGVIRDCDNEGSVGYRHMGYNIGGIAGSQTGYIVGCSNYAQIYGRKEVGGIVGQMEPVTRIQYSVDTLQILQGQLDTLSGLVSRASGNAQTNAANISSQIGILKDQAETAKDAVDTLLPDAEAPELPDGDTVLAAQNALTSSLGAMPGTLDSITATTKNTVSSLSRDMQAIVNQMSAMEQTVGGASENLGGSLQDVSDADTAEDLTGKVEGCVNGGDVLADANVGGIAGAIAFENDLDPEEDLQISGDSSLNFAGELRAVILSCENKATVTAGKQNAGGIVGWQSMGLVKDCRSSGTLDAEGADYAGGIAGSSSGYIRGSSAKCEITGGAYVGGIAGSGAVVSDCRSMAVIHGSEKMGAVLGVRDESYGQEENPIRGNYYLSAREDIGAIDGISYAGCAEPLELDAFLVLEGLPEMFRSSTVTFLFDDGTEAAVTVAAGGALDASQIPAVPQKFGYTGVWKGLEETELSAIHFDTVFQAVYTSRGMTIQSEATRNNDLPILLLEGSFTNHATVTVSKSENIPDGDLGGLIEAWELTVSEGERAETARFLPQEDCDPDALVLLVRDAKGSWTETDYTVDGSYLVFPLEKGAQSIAIIQAEAPLWPWLAAAAGAAVLAAALAVVLCRRKKPAQKAKA